jgi:hypothetical protein
MVHSHRCFQFLGIPPKGERVWLINTTVVWVCSFQFLPPEGGTTRGAQRRRVSNF